MKTQNKNAGIATRELWLDSAVAAARDFFKAKGHELPPVRVSCGWPSSKALGRKKRCMGECWDSDASADKLHQIFISPLLEHEVTSDGQGVLPVLVHELVHATVGIKAKHGKVFGACARSVGLEGKLTSTVAGAELIEICEGWTKSLGKYPHAEIDPMLRPVKKQTTRLVKAECPKCGYNVRVTRKWLDEVGAPLCPCNKLPMTFEVPDELDPEEERGEE